MHDGRRAQRRSRQSTWRSASRSSPPLQTTTIRWPPNDDCARASSRIVQFAAAARIVPPLSGFTLRANATGFSAGIVLLLLLMIVVSLRQLSPSFDDCRSHKMSSFRRRCRATRLQSWLSSSCVLSSDCRHRSMIVKRRVEANKSWSTIYRRAPNSRHLA